MRSVLASFALALAACASSTPAAPTDPAQTETAVAAESPDAEVAVADSAAPPASAGNFSFLDEPGVPLEQVGLVAADMNADADPCVDFYEFACGGWLEKTEIPADRSRTGRFTEIQDRNQQELKRILEQAATNKGSRIGQFYSACMDEEAIEKQGLDGIAPLLKKVRRVKTPAQISAAIAELHKNGLNPVFSIDVDFDFKDTSKVIAYLYQGGLGLPTRDYYFDDDKAPIREAYKTYITNTMKLLGKSDTDAAQAADDVMAIDTALAEVSKTPIEMRNVQGLYNPVDRKQLAKLAPTFDWKRFYRTLRAPQMKAMSVTSKEFFEGFNAALTSQPARAWRHYLEWDVLSFFGNRLPKAYADEAFKFTQVLTGQKERRARWKRCVAATDAAMPDDLGRSFVETMFPGNAKNAAEQMVFGISDAFKESVASYAWMDDATKAKAIEKREMMAYLIGYPDRWRDHRFKVGTNYAANSLAAFAEDRAYKLAKLGKPADRTEWGMSAPTVNAYYHPLKNHMVFPAGILQRPFYDSSASVAVNLGGMGMIVGHELTHGFDDQGAQFAGDGTATNWWTEEASKNFEAKGQCVIDQYSKYEPLPGVNLKGELTLGENIADMGGVKLSFMAYRALRAGQEPVVAGGLTEDQQFFVALGQAWCAKSTDRMARLLVENDPHSPPRFRVNGSLSNSPEFAEAFSCNVGAPMRPANTCSVW